MKRENSYSDTSMLTPEERKEVAAARELHRHMKTIPPHKRSKLSPEKQDFPIGIRPDGTLNLVTPDEEPKRESPDRDQDEDQATDEA
jgi:hypothetical protein